MSETRMRPGSTAEALAGPAPANEPEVVPPGPLDTADDTEILDSLKRFVWWPEKVKESNVYRLRVVEILTWLRGLHGATWQERWHEAERLHDAKWRGGIAESLIAATGRHQNLSGSALSLLIQIRLFRPSYRFLTDFRPRALYARTRSLNSTERFDRAEQAGLADGMAGRHIAHALKVLSMIVISTGKPLEEIEAADLLEFRDKLPWRDGGRAFPGLHGAWRLLVNLEQIEAGTSLTSASRAGQRPTVELVDAYGIKSASVRAVLIRYLDERRPGLDYNSLLDQLSALAGTFWSDIERHHPGIDSLELSDEVATAWKERIRYRDRGGKQVPRKNYFALLAKVRGFYLDIAEWALEDPSWAPWAVPCPIRRSESDGAAKVKQVVKAEIHQRIRERLPHLPRLVEAAETWKQESAALLAAAEQALPDTSFIHEGREYWRTEPALSRKSTTQQGPPRILTTDVATGETIDANAQEDQAFCAWACVETLRHTGTRVEELLELTHLALVSYRLPDTGEVIPLLQIIPSKSNEERLLLVTPELASVLACIIARLRRTGGTIPLVARYDNHERLTCPELPHLFQRQRGWQRQVVCRTTVQNLLTAVLERTGLTDRTGQPLRYTPHDFRRMFATEAVTGGLPVHIAAKILGHANINTTQGYTAVFQDDLIRTYRAFVDRRRATRPNEEYREPTAEEWIEFQQHFALRKVELGTCGRPYGTPCAHEHACIRCPMLRVDPRAKGQLQEIIANLTERIEEARANGWLGEVEGLRTSQSAAISKLAALNRAECNLPNLIDLGIPSVHRRP
jgi:site-specific recombinase XerD